MTNEPASADHSRTTSAKIQTNAGDADYRPAINQLDWAVWHAKQLGFGVPAHIEAALLILKEEAPVYFFSTLGRDPTILCMSAQSSEDMSEQIELLEVVKGQMERRLARKNEKAAKAVENIAHTVAALWPEVSAEDLPKCASCGRPRSRHSVHQCRSCYEAGAPLPSTTPAGAVV